MFKVQEEDLPGDALSVFNLKDDFEFIQNVRATTAARKREAGPPLEAELATRAAARGTQPPRACTQCDKNLKDIEMKRTVGAV